MDRARAWVLNLSSEDELARAHQGGGATPSLAARSREKSLEEALRASGLVREIDRVTDPFDRKPPSLAGRVGIAWCPTPHALRALARAGATVPRAPSVSVLRAVTDRCFAWTLDAARSRPSRAEGYYSSAPHLIEALASITEPHVLKRCFSFAGRGRLVVDPLERRDERVARWVRASISTGRGLVCEPWVTREADYALHGHLAPDGSLVLGEPTRQWLTRTGAWERTERCAASDLAPGERAALFEAAAECARVLTGAGYFGPFGLDAYRWTDPAGSAHFRALCELNARYTMGWAAGMGDRRPDLFL